MERGGALPDRCVVCNGAAGKRVSRTLYWSPAAWRYFSTFMPFVLLLGGFGMGSATLALFFWPALILLVVAHYFVRKRLTLDVGICARHQRQRNILSALSIAALVAAVLMLINLSPDDDSMLLLVTTLVSVVALAVAQSNVGVQAVSLKKFDSQHAWLGGVGRAFREALPELPRA
jgi:hypothetical protein